MRRLPAVFALALTFGLAAVFGLSGCTDVPTNAQEDLLTKSAQETIAKSLADDIGPSGIVPNEFTWANDDVFEMLSPDFPTDSEEPSHRPLYVVAPQDDPHSPQHPGHEGDNPHDHVVSIAPGTYSAEWHVLVVLNTNTGELAEAGVDGAALTNAQAVENAVDQLDHVILHDTGFVFTCPIRPHAPHSDDHS